MLTSGSFITNCHPSLTNLIQLQNQKHQSLGHSHEDCHIFCLFSLLRHQDREVFFIFIFFLISDMSRGAPRVGSSVGSMDWGSSVTRLAWQLAWVLLGLHDFSAFLTFLQFSFLPLLHSNLNCVLALCRLEFWPIYADMHKRT